MATVNRILQTHDAIRITVSDDFVPLTLSGQGGDQAREQQILPARGVSIWFSHGKNVKIIQRFQVTRFEFVT